MILLCHIRPDARAANGTSSHAPTMRPRWTRRSSRLLTVKVCHLSFSLMLHRTFRPKPRPHSRPDLPCAIARGICRLRALGLRVHVNGLVTVPASSFRECSHYGPPKTLFAFGKRLIPATHPTMQSYIWTWFPDHASTVETLA